MIKFPLPLLGFAAFSGTGKTTLLIQLLPLLVKKGLRVGMIKHSHHDIELDKPSKDSYKLRQAGASQLLLAGTKRAILFHEYEQLEREQTLTEQLDLLDISSLDLVLVEGYRDESFAKIELHRNTFDKPFLYKNDANIIALACDENRADCDITQLDINDPIAICEFVLT